MNVHIDGELQEASDEKSHSGQHHAEAHALERPGVVVVMVVVVVVVVGVVVVVVLWCWW